MTYGGALPRHTKAMLATALGALPRAFAATRRADVIRRDRARYGAMVGVVQGMQAVLPRLHGVQDATAASQVVATSLASALPQPAAAILHVVEDGGTHIVAVCGCVAVWLCGCVAVRLCGCVAVWWASLHVPSSFSLASPRIWESMGADTLARSCARRAASAGVLWPSSTVGVAPGIPICSQPPLHTHTLPLHTHARYRRHQSHTATATHTRPHTL